MTRSFARFAVRATAFALLLFLASCEEGGTFSVEFRFEGEPELPTTTYAYAKVELPEAGQEEKQKRVIAAGPSEYGPGMELAFPSVPNGEGRVVQVELRDNGGEGAQVLYYGRSEPFAIKPGEHVVVPVAMKLRAAPASGPASGGVKIVSHLGSGYVSSEKVAIELYAPKGAVKALLSNEPTVPATSEKNTIEIAADGAVSAPEGFVGVRYEGWELATCPERSECVRTVYAWFVDENGVRSRATSGQVIVDRIEPKAVSAAANRAELKRGEELTIAVQASEPLLGDEAKEAITAAVYRAGETTPVEGFALSLVEGTQYVFRHEVTASDVDGAYEAAFTFTDRAGNEGKSERVKFAVDSVAPVVTLEMPARTRFSAQTGFETLELKASATEAWTKLVATVGGRAMACVESGLAATCRFTVTPDLKASDGVTALSAIEEEGESVQVRVEDAAGNAGEASASVVFDLKAPSATLRAQSVKVGQGGTMAVLVQPTEPVESAASLTPRIVGPLGTPSFALSHVAGTNFLFQHTLEPSDPEGLYRFTVSIVDRVGNVGVSEQASIETSQHPPVLTIAPNARRFSAIPGFRRVEVDVRSSSDVSLPSATIGGRPMACLSAGTLRHFTCSFEVTSELRSIDGATALAELDEEIEAIVVSATDAFGDSGQAGTNVAFDLRPPAATVRPASTRLGQADTISLLVQPSEPVDGPASLTPVLQAPGGRPAELSLVPGTSFLFEHVLVPSDPDGRYTVLVRLVDRTGNEGVSESVTLDVDQLPPTVTLAPSGGSRFSAVEGHDRVVVGVQASEDVAFPRATIGGRPMACSRGVVPRSFECLYIVTPALRTSDGRVLLSSIEEESESIVVQAADLSGNVGRADLNVVFDLWAPTAALTLAPAFRREERVSVFVQPSEPLAGSDALLPNVTVASGAPGFALAHVAGSAYVFEHAPTASDPDGAYDLSFGVVDRAGNVGTSAHATFRLDRAPPVLTLTLPERRVFSANPGYDTLSLQVAASEDVSLPVATVGGRFMACAAGETARSFTCQYVVSRDETVTDGSSRLDALESESEPIVVTASDKAGNAGQAGASVVFDLKPPTASLRAASSWVEKGGTASVFVQPSEPLASAASITPLVFAPAGAAAFTLAHVPGTSYLFEHVLTSHDDDGTYAVRFRLADPAGNVATTAPVELDVDQRPPVVTIAPLARTRFSAVDGFRDVEVSFASTEPLAATDVTVGGRAMTCAPGSAPLTTKCTYRLVPKELAADGVTFLDEVAEESESVVVAGADAAGNEVRASTNVVFDQRGPELSSASVTYEAPSTSPIARISLASPGSVIRVAALFGEAIEPSPSLTARSGSTALAFALDSATSAGAQFSWRVAGDPPDGIYLPSLSATDLAGNSTVASFVTPKIELATSVPVLSVDQTKVRFLRSPIGSGLDEPMGAFTMPGGGYFALAPADPLSTSDTLPASTFALDRGALVLVRVWSGGGTTGNLMGAMEPAAGGSWPRARLAALDVPFAFVSGVDAAGNESARVRIDHGQWVATSGTASIGTSPHKVALASRATEAATLDVMSALIPSGAAVQADGRSEIAHAEAEWRRLKVATTAPPARNDHAMAYDAARGRLVLFGGTVSNLDDGSSLADTWEWDGSAWLDVTPAGLSPAARHGHALAYDAARGRVVLFGGSDATSSYRGDTWEWDGETWVDVTPAAGPAPRTGHAMTYDPRLRRIVMCGGRGETLLPGETWLWDGRSWKALASAADEPTNRVAASMTFDGRLQRTVLFGGVSDSGLLRNDLWTFDGTRWAPVAGTGPSARVHAALAYDPVRAVLVLAGGSDRTDFNSETWEWGAAGWRLVSTASLGLRSAAVLAYDVRHGRMVLNGGNVQTFYNWLGSRRSTYATSNETWFWNGTKWALRALVKSTPSDRITEAVYDESRGRLVVFGGLTPSGAGTDVLNGTWEWDGNNWELRLPSTSPPARRDYAMAYDAGRKRTVIFGGRPVVGFAFDDTWEWDGTNWTQVATVGPRPDARYGHAMAYDSTRKKIVLFGGEGDFMVNPFGDTWEWDGTRWEHRWPAGTLPWGRSAHRLVYDPVRQRTVLFGGYIDSRSSVFSDVWEYDGLAWVEKLSAKSPTARAHFGATYDATVGGVVVVGGIGSSLVFDDVWMWDGASWVERPCKTVKPSERYGSALAYDSDRKKSLLFGGFSVTFESDLWAMDLAPDRQPAAQFDADVKTLGVEPAAIEGMRVRAYCGGAFSPFATADVGADLLGWNGGEEVGWSVLASNTTGLATVAGAPHGLIDWRSGTADEARRLVRERDLALSFQCRPAGTSGKGASEAGVALDYIEVRVDYVAP